MMNSQTSLMHPCFFGVTLQQGAQLIAGINVVFSALLMIVFTIYIFMFEGAAAEAARVNGTDEGVATIFFVVWIIFMIIFLISIAGHVVLLKGATEKSPKKIKIYLIISIVLLLLGLIGSLTHTFSVAMALITFLLYLPYLYELWMVFCFFKEISGPQPQSEYEET